MGNSSVNPFLEYRHHLDVHAYALERGLEDRDFVALVTETNERIQATDGVGFVITPLIELDLDAPDGGAAGTGRSRVLAKVETAAVGGSHKARHLFGLILHRLVTEATEPARGPRPDLAIASCGNAAIGAAVVARATDRVLRVFVPTTADPAIIDRLDGLGALVTQCPRIPGVTGDPSVAALDDAVRAGAEAFTVQGTRCPPVIDGCRTLGLELAAQLDERGAVPGALYIQIGGGALATAVVDGLRRAWPDRELPRLHPVQARAAHPYVAGWHRIADAVVEAVVDDAPGSEPVPEASWARSRLAAQRLLTEALAGESPDRLDPARVQVALARYQALMTPWPDTPHSVASGIVDDITYDWLTVAAHQVITGGWPILVDEHTFVEAALLAGRSASPPPDETGAAGLAGLLAHRQSRDENGPVAEPAVVLLTGAAH